MSDQNDRKKAAEEEVQEANRDLANGDFADAERHLAQATKLGAPRDRVRWMRRNIVTAEQEVDRKARRGGRYGFLTAAVCYFLLSLQQPAEWGVPAWMILSLVVVPAFCGFIVGRVQRGAREARGRFFAGMRAAAWAEALYAIINLMLVRSRIGSGADSGSILMVGAFVTVVYAIAAGIVSGITAGWIAHRDRREELA